MAEFRALVAALHAAGIEVILDVVYNHTGEGGPGDDRLVAARPRAAHATSATHDVTGTGNSLDASSPHVQRSCSTRCATG